MKDQQRIVGIDSIRFICALMVFLGHKRLPLPASFDGPNAFGIKKLIGTVLQLSLNGPAAVIIFFIISGFCIHYPFRTDYTRIHLPSYYVRRLIRISIPAIIAIALYIFLGKDLTPPSYGVFWSVICEVVYYLLYPLILIFRKYLTWEKIIAACFLVAIILNLLSPGAIKASSGDYAIYGVFQWLLGLPCWLLGCWLAENYQRFSLLSKLKINGLRLSIVIVSIALYAIRFHVHSVYTSFVYTLSFFAFPACLWFGYEIVYFQTNKPWRFLEWCGKWSYSLYITHGLAGPIIAITGLVTLSAFIANPFIVILLTFIIALIFYFLIEYPSHKIAVILSKKVKSVNKTVLAEATA